MTVKIVQYARHINRQTGVGSVASHLEEEFAALGYATGRVTLESLHLGAITRLSRISPYLASFVEVLAYSIAAPVVWYLRDRGRTVVITHNDCIAGDIYINHGVHRSVVWPTSGKQNMRVLLHPLHAFLYLREAIRFQLRGHRIIVNFSEYGERELEHYFRLTGFATAVIPNGVDLRRFHVDAGLRSSKREQLQLDEDAFVTVFVANEYKRKGLDVLADALRLLDESVVALVVGGTPAEVAKARARHRDLGDRLRFVGRQTDDLTAHYNAADVLVLPTAQEAWPLVLLEAMACGLPCLATPVSSIPEVVMHGENGLILERTARSFADGIRHVRRDPAVIARMRESALTTAALYGWPAIGRKYAALIEGLFAARGHRSQDE